MTTYSTTVTLGATATGNVLIPPPGTTVVVTPGLKGDKGDPGPAGPLSAVSVSDHGLYATIAADGVGATLSDNGSYATLTVN